MLPASLFNRALPFVGAVLVVTHASRLAAQSSAHDGHDAKRPSTTTADSTSLRQLGTVHFPNAGAQAAQAPFLQGITLLHHFHYPEAALRFRQAQVADPSFALAYWGEALSYSALLWGYESLDSSRAVLARLGPTTTARLARARTPDERAFGTVVEAFYQEGTAAVRAKAAADAARLWIAAAPGGEEPLAFASLTALLQGITTRGPARDALLDESARDAQRLFDRNPRHPGAAHYLIHAYDRPATAARGLVAARAYDRIAPDAEHALHMPSHIYYQLGLWPEMARSNERAWAASRTPAYGTRRAPGDAHDLAWLQYAYLQQGRWHAARALVDTARRLWGDVHDFAGDPDGAHAATVLAFRYGADTGDWSAWPAASDPMGARADEVANPNGTPASRRARTMGLARAYYEAAGALLARGDTTRAAVTAARLAARAGPDDEPLVQVAHAMAAQLEGLLAEQRKDVASAIAAYTRATSILPEGGASIPAMLSSRELLASALLASGDARIAATQYDAALASFPNRSTLLLRSARAHKAAHDTVESARAYAALHVNWASADSDITALNTARREK